MRKVYLSFGILIVVTLFLTGCGVFIGNALKDMRALIRKETVDVEAITEKWDSVSFALELTVIRSEYEAAEEALSELRNDKRNKSEPSVVSERLDHILARIQEGFVPSFSGVF